MKISKNQFVAEKLPEGFKVIPSFPDYAVSGNNEFIRITKAMGARPGKKLSVYTSADGYLKATLTLNGRPHSRYFHELVCAAFIGGRPNGYQINHIDGNKLNNSPENLEYCTISENIKHAFRLGLQKPKIQYGPLNHKWKGGLLNLTCHFCGKEFTRERTGKEYIHDFCSSKCHWDHQKGKTIAERAAL